MEKEEMFQLLNENAETFESMADDVWSYAEVNYAEFKSVEREKAFFKDAGFRVKKEADIETAFSAEYGQGKPVIAILGEYDALDGLEQKADMFEQCPEEGMKTGHGCGHNLLGTAAVEAVFGVAEYLKANNLPGTIRYYGTPAEEGGAGKIYMINAGCFEDVDVAISWHPANCSNVMGGSLASINTKFNFKGIAAHAAGAPDKGRSALDAAELLNVGTQFLREHVPDDVRIHYSFLDVGGTRPNIVQSTSSVVYVIRANTFEVAKEVYERVCAIGEGAALMTGTELEPHGVMNSYSNVIPNTTLINVMASNADLLYPIEFTEAEKEYASKYNASVGGDSSKSYVTEYDKNVNPFFGSTDFGDVSWVVPSVGINSCTFAADTVAHSWAWTAQGKSSGAHKGMHVAAKMMAGCSIDLFTDSKLVLKAKEEFNQKMDGKKYVSLRPTDIPPVNQY